MSSSPTPVIPDAPGVTHRPACEFSQFVTDATGTVQRCRIVGTEALWGSPEQLLGLKLFDQLSSAQPRWRSLLPAQPGDGPDSRFLPSPHEQLPSFGYRLHRLALPEGYVFTITPELAPASTLGQEGFAGLALRPDSLAQLFMRHCLLESRMQSYLLNFPGVVFSRRSDLSFSYLGPRCEELTGLSPPTSPRTATPSRRSSTNPTARPTPRNPQLTPPAAPSRSPTASSTPRRARSATSWMCATPARSASGLPLGCDGMWLDITREKVAELRLNENGWKATLAVLTSGLLHDFGNLLSGIYSLSELYHAQLPADSSMVEGLGMIKEHARQAQMLVKKISSLNRDTIGRRNYYSLNRLTQEQLELIGPILPKGIKLATDFPPEEIPVYLDEVAFRQAVVNFAINARDAMGTQGGILIQLAAPAHPEDFADVTFRSPPNWKRNYAALVFSDTGCGIPPEKIAKIFDPSSPPSRAIAAPASASTPPSSSPKTKAVTSAPAAASAAART
jgi:PAS domain-containing protein